MIDVAAGSYEYAGSLEVEAQDRFGPTKYWQEINRLLLPEAAVAYRPAAVARLNEQRKRSSTIRPPSRISDRMAG